MTMMYGFETFVKRGSGATNKNISSCANYKQTKNTT